jgi:aryl-alcohol dehydrogenase-like predicted oxidoreductase
MNREEEREMLPLCRAEGIGVVPWSPLARGRLARAWQAPSSSDRVRHDLTAAHLYSPTEDADKLVVDAVGEVAQARNLSRAQVALAWLLQCPGITAPIVGVTKAQHLEDALAALTIELEPEAIDLLEIRYVPHASSFFS